MLEKSEGKRRRGWQRMRWLDNITTSIEMNLRKLQKIVEDRGAWHPTVHGVAKSQTRLSGWSTITYSVYRDCFFYCCLVDQCVWLFATPWTVTHQAFLSMGILQARILEWVAMPSSRGSSWPRDQTQVSCIGKQVSLPLAPPGKPQIKYCESESGLFATPWIYSPWNSPWPEYWSG